MVGRSSVDAKHVVTVGGGSREHAGLRVGDGRLTSKDASRCSGSPLDGENPENGHPRLIRVGGHIGLRDIELDKYPPNVRY